MPRQLTSQFDTTSGRKLLLQLVLPFYLPSFIVSFAYGLLQPVLPLYAADFDISYALIGVVIAGEGFGMLAGDLPGGLLIRRLGIKQAMIAGLLLSAISQIGIFAANSVGLAILFRMLGGFFLSLYAIGRHTFLAQTVPARTRGRLTGLLGGVFRLGMLAGPAVGGLAASAFNLRVPFLVAGAALGLAGAMVVIFLRDPDGQPSARAGATISVRTMWETLRDNRPIWLTAGTGFVLSGIIRIARNVIIPLYGADVIGLDVKDIGYVMSIMSAVDSAMFIPAGMVMDRFGRKWAIVPSFALLGLGIALLPLTGTFISLALVGAFIGFANGLGSGTMLTISSDLAPPDTRGEFLGIWRFVGDAGFTAAPLIVGTVADLLALSAAALAMGVIGAAAAAVFLFFVPETLRKEPD